MDNVTDMYLEEVTPANQVKGFTKSFVKRTKAKREENLSVKELLGYLKDNKVKIGAKITAKNFKTGKVEKVFASSNCDDLTLRTINHYAKIANVEIVMLDLDNEELGQKLVKPFLVSMVCIVKN